MLLDRGKLTHVLVRFACFVFTTMKNNRRRLRWDNFLFWHVPNEPYFVDVNRSLNSGNGEVSLQRNACAQRMKVNLCNQTGCSHKMQKRGYKERTWIHRMSHANSSFDKVPRYHQLCLHVPWPMGQKVWCVAALASILVVLHISYPAKRLDFHRGNPVLIWTCWVCIGWYGFAWSSILQLRQLEADLILGILNATDFEWICQSKLVFIAHILTQGETLFSWHILPNFSTWALVKIGSPPFVHCGQRRTGNTWANQSAAADTGWHMHTARRNLHFWVNFWCPMSKSMLYSLVYCVIRYFIIGIPE